ncbi:MAG TPA: hypothetical protein DCL07_00750, partial [Cryomorphaceae bacterium]|nr:hypothetical protein [Cryomorphaceae bacterium]
RNYYVTSVIQSRIQWVNNQKDGLSVWYHDNGLPAVEFPYVRGEIHGEGRYYDTEGKLEKTLRYVHNQIIAN